MSKHLLLFILILAVCTNVFAQQTKSISGVVYDSNTGEALIGVSVLEVGTTNGTITDFDGNFLLNANKGDIIVISFIGYLTQELPAATSLNVILKDDTETLEEVVVIGYGVAKKNDLTGSVTAMKPDGLCSCWAPLCCWFRRCQPATGLTTLVCSHSFSTR